MSLPSVSLACLARVCAPRDGRDRIIFLEGMLRVRPLVDVA
jgi:hypothetical protein